MACLDNKSHWKFESAFQLHVVSYLGNLYIYNGVSVPATVLCICEHFTNVVCELLLDIAQREGKISPKVDEIGTVTGLVSPRWQAPGPARPPQQPGWPGPPPPCNVHTRLTRLTYTLPHTIYVELCNLTDLHPTAYNICRALQPG